MRKNLMVFVVLLGVLGIGYTAHWNSIKTEATEDKELICNQLTDYVSWSTAQNVTNKVMTFRKENALPYEPSGVYNLTGYNCKVYTFDPPNDFYEVVRMNESEDYVFIIHNTGDHGVSFQSIVYKKGAFHGLTSNYVLFEEPDSSITAVSIKEKDPATLSINQKDHLEIGSKYMRFIKDFNELSSTEKKTVVYPNGSYQCKF